MNQDFLAAIVQLVQTGGYVQVHCHTNYDPKIVEIDIPAGFSLTLPYDTYQQIRAQAGLPDDVCRDNSES